MCQGLPVLFFRYAAAEVDCITALALDPLYVKAYLRLGASRFGLKKFAEAKDSYQKALQLEPQNKTAQIEIDKIDKVKHKPGVLQFFFEFALFVKFVNILTVTNRHDD